MIKTKQSSDQNFNTISIHIASPEVIAKWSFGEITKPETINYRTQRSERGGKSMNYCTKTKKSDSND